MALALLAFVALRGLLKRDVEPVTQASPELATAAAASVTDEVSEATVAGSAPDDDYTSTDDDSHVVPFARPSGSPDLDTGKGDDRRAA